MQDDMQLQFPGQGIGFFFVFLFFFYAMRRVIVRKGHQCAVYETETLLLQWGLTERLIVLCIIAEVVRFSV